MCFGSMTLVCFTKYPFAEVHFTSEHLLIKELLSAHLSMYISRRCTCLSRIYLDLWHYQSNHVN